VSTEFDGSRAVPWVRRNVLDRLPSPGDRAWRSRAEIRDDLRGFLNAPLRARPHVEIELWAWYAAYDHVALAQLWGPMTELPREIPRFTKDLRQLWDDCGRPELPPARARRHDALVDARHNLARWRAMTAAGTGDGCAGSARAGHGPADPGQREGGGCGRPWRRCRLAVRRRARLRARRPASSYGPARHPRNGGRAIMRIGVLTGGGDCPGLNAVIRAVVRKGITDFGYEFVGFRNGWRGPLENLTRPLDVQSVRGILPRGGTILGSSRTNPFKIDGGVEKIKANLADQSVDALVAIGGEDTLGVAAKLYDLGVRVVGVPKTIDNDLNATDYTFGFDTAVNIAMEAIDRLHTTAESHHRCLVVEVMGRHAGWIALHAGMAGGANVILVPERRFDIEQVARYVE